MLDVAVNFLTKELNAYLVARTGVTFGAALLSVLQTDTGKWAIPDDGIGVALVTAWRNVPSRRSCRRAIYADGHHVVLEPELKLNLNLLFAANFKQYDQGLRQLAYVLTFFQARTVFTAERYPGLDPRIEKLGVDLVSLTFEQLNQLWAFVGAKQLPSALYRVRLVALQDLEPSAVRPPNHHHRLELSRRYDDRVPAAAHTGGHARLLRRALSGLRVLDSVGGPGGRSPAGARSRRRARTASTCFSRSRKVARCSSRSCRSPGGRCSSDCNCRRPPSRISPSCHSCWRRSSPVSQRRRRSRPTPGAGDADARPGARGRRRATPRRTVLPGGDHGGRRLLRRAAGLRIPFKARAETLRYYVVARNYTASEFNQLDVSDAGFAADARPEIRFDRIPPSSFTRPRSRPRNSAAATRE